VARDEAAVARSPGRKRYNAPAMSAPRINAPIISPAEIIRPTHVEVNLRRITENYRAIERAVGGAKVMAILKANAYGHGLVEVARHLVSLGAPYLGVAFLEEGILLRQAGIEAPILVMGGIIGNQVPLFLRHNLTLTASSVDKLRQIDEAAGALGLTAKVHLKVDTGMERIGVHHFSADKLLEAALACSCCVVEGLYSHFASSDAADLGFARQQLSRFLEVLGRYEQRGIPRPPLCHIANSGAILQLPESHLDLVRPGILLYGVYPSEEARRSIPVRPALSWRSRVVYFKVVGPGQPVSYGSTWKSETQVRLVTVPVGYGDGYFRAMSGKAEVILRGKRYPVVGRICMDQLMVNLGWDSAYNNDEVLLIGEDPSTGAQIRCEDLAAWADTIPYEILTNINTRVPRIYTDAE
jgi:alanine racemase